MDNAEPTVEIFDGTPKKADVVLVPNFLSDQLGTDFGLAINMQSFMEMTDAQIGFYCSFLKSNLKGILYSSNVDRVPHNPGLSKTVTDHLAEHFFLSPHPSFYDKAFKKTDRHWTNYYRRYIASEGRAFPVSFTPSDGQGQIVGGIMKLGNVLLRQQSLPTRPTSIRIWLAG